MNQVGEGSLIIEDGKVIGDIQDDVADKWAQEYSGNNNSEEVLSEKWTNEYNEPQSTDNSK